MHSLRSVAATLVVALALIAVTPASREVLAAPALTQLRGIQELKSWFNASKGHPRLILLLSPT